MGSNSSEVTSAYLAKLTEIGNTLSADSSTTSSLYSQYVSSGSTTSISDASSYLSSLASGTSSSATGSYLSEADKESDAAVSSCLSSMDMSSLYGSYGLSDLQNSVSMLTGSTTSQTTSLTGQTTSVTDLTASTASQTATSVTMPDFSSYLNNGVTQGIDAYGIASTYTNGTSALNFDGFTAGTVQHDAAQSSTTSYADALANANSMYQSGDYSSLYQSQSANSQIKNAYTSFMNTYMSSMGMDADEINNVMSFYSSSFDSYASALTSYNSSFDSSVTNAYSNLTGVKTETEEQEG